MSDEPEPYRREVRMGGRMNGKTAHFNAMTRDALERGEHVVVADRESMWCLADDCGCCGGVPIQFTG